MERFVLKVVALAAGVTLSFGGSAMAEEPGPTAKEMAATAAYVAGLQNRDGGFGWKLGEASDLGATSTAIRTLKYAGGTPKDALGCVAFIRSCRDDSTGGFAPTPGGKPALSATAQGLVALTELGLSADERTSAGVEFLRGRTESVADIRITAAVLGRMGRPPRDSADWARKVAAVQNRDGTWGSGGGKVAETGGHADTMALLGATLDQADRVIETLKGGQREDGGWGRDDGGSDLFTTYVVARAFHSLKAGPDVPRLTRFITNCRRSDGSYAATPKGEPDLRSTYFALYVLRLTREMTKGK